LSSCFSSRSALADRHHRYHHYSETGYVGQDPSTILTRLLHAADDNPLLASIGIVCLDEFDKIASGQNNAVFAGAARPRTSPAWRAARAAEDARVVGGRGAAGADPLDLMVTTSCSRPPMSRSCGGRVLGISSGRAQPRLARPHRFRARPGAARRGGRRHRSQLHVGRGRAPRHFQAFGFLPELLARFTRFVPFEALDATTLMDILRSSVIERLTREFEDEGSSWSSRTTS